MATRSTFLAATALVAAAVVGGCYTGSAVDVNRTPDGTTTSTDGTAPALKAGSNVHGLTHLPCDVEKLLSDACWQCHGTVPGYGASTTLVTWDQVAADTPYAMKEADIMLLRMQATENMMPPDNPATSDQIAVLQNWINAGYPQGHCGEDADAGAEGGASGNGSGDDDDDVTTQASNAPSVCTSGRTIASTVKDDTMKPGEACLSCHNTGAKTPFTMAGTVFPTLNEPDDCAGTMVPNVVIVDANNVTHTYSPSTSGNFFETEDIPGPYKVMVTSSASTRQMKTLVANGDCNACHTANPQPGQPGRIIGP